MDHFYSNIPARKKWHGYKIFAVDGSRIELPNSKSSFDFFGQMFTIADADGHKKSFTQGLAPIIYDDLESLNIYDNSIVIFDRGYYSEQLFTHCQPWAFMFDAVKREA